MEDTFTQLRRELEKLISSKASSESIETKRKEILHEFFSQKQKPAFLVSNCTISPKSIIYSSPKDESNPYYNKAFGDCKRCKRKSG